MIRPSINANYESSVISHRGIFWSYWPNIWCPCTRGICAHICKIWSFLWLSLWLGGTSTDGNTMIVQTDSLAFMSNEQKRRHYCPGYLKIAARHNITQWKKNNENRKLCQSHYIFLSHVNHSYVHFFYGRNENVHLFNPVANFSFWFVCTCTVVLNFEAYLNEFPCPNGNMKE